MKINGKEIKLETQTILSGILKDQGFNLLKLTTSRLSLSFINVLSYSAFGTILYLMVSRLKRSI